MKIKLISDKSFYSMLFKLALPIAFLDLLKFGLNLADNVMVGALSEQELSGVSLANQPFFIFSLIIFGLSSGGTVLIAQYFGKRDYTSINKIVGITVMSAMAITVVVGAIMLFFPEPVMRIFIPDESVVAIGARYMRISAWTYLLYGISSTFVLILRSVEIVKPSMYIGIISFCINLFLNWVLIFGNLGAPKLGVEGAAIATLVARLFDTVGILLYVRFKDKILKLRFKSILKLDFSYFKDFFKYGCPVLLNEFAWSLGVCMIPVVLGRIGSGAVAAASITSSVQQVVCVLQLAISAATSIVVGKMLGEGKRDYAIRASRTLLTMSMSLGIVLAGILYLLRMPILSLYVLTPDTYELCLAMLNFTCIIVAVDSVSSISIVGIMRGGGDTTYTMLADMLTLWLFAVPLGILSAMVWHWPVIVTFMLLRSDVILRSAICIPRIFNNKWIHDVTRV